MRAASSALIALLNSDLTFFVADLLTITPATGSPIYLTGAPVDVVSSSRVDSLTHTFKSGGVRADGSVQPVFTRGEVKLVIGTQVDSMTVTLMTAVAATVTGIPWTQAARQGFFDGARICLERAFMPTWGDVSAGTLISFWGRVGQVQPSRTTVVITVASDLSLLQLPAPRNIYQPGCLHNVYDAGCTLLKSAFTVSGAATSGSTTSSVNTTLTQADNYFSLGGITFTSGANAGVTRTIKSYGQLGGVIVPALPFPLAPAAGDSFTAFPGCDKVIAGPNPSSGLPDVNYGTCKVKFNNLAHARGYPFIPTPETGT